VRAFFTDGDVASFHESFLVEDVVRGYGNTNEVRRCVHCGRMGKLHNACTDCLDDMSRRLLLLDPEAGKEKPGRKSTKVNLPPTVFVREKHVKHRC